MGRIANSLARMKVNLQTVTELTAVYVYPTDYPFTINADRLPVSIIHRMPNLPEPILTTSVGNERQRWTMMIDILQQIGPLMNQAQIATAEALYEPWLDRIRILLAADRQLGGTAVTIGAGPGNVFVTPINTQLRWFDKSYWGIRFQLPILQDLPSSL